jgi:phage baseplate assembly protein W
MSRKTTELPVYGRGLGFPFRLNPSTGGVVTTAGNTDATSVALEYLQDSWSIRETVTPNVNHIAESIAHILLTRPGEHDTLPEFGSYIFMILFEPNTYEFRQIAEVYFKTSTVRWEKRARIPDMFDTIGYEGDSNKYGRFSGVRWKTTGRQADLGEVPMWVTIDFVTRQVPGNLVSPFVTDRVSRLQEYPSGNIDAAGHDYVSRYKGGPTSVRDGSPYTRIMPYKNLSLSSGDSYHTIIRGDTWLSLSWKFYGDIRYWYVLARNYIADSAAAGLNREHMDTLGDPPLSASLRIPSKQRIMMEIVNG